MAPSDLPEEPTRDPAGHGFVASHAASIGAVALALFALVKAYAAANFSLTTTSALLTTAPLGVLLGTLASYSYQIFPLLGLAGVAWVASIYRASGWTPICTAVAGFSVLAFLISPWPNLWPPALVFLSVVASHTLARRWVGGRFPRYATRWLPTSWPRPSGWSLRRCPTCGCRSRSLRPRPRPGAKSW